MITVLSVTILSFFVIYICRSYSSFKKLLSTFYLTFSYLVPVVPMMFAMSRGYINTRIHTHTHTERERERGRERDTHTHIITQIRFLRICTTLSQRSLHGITDSPVGHRTLLPGFKLRPGYIRRVFHLSHPLIIFGGR